MYKFDEINSKGILLFEIEFICIRLSYGNSIQ